MQYTAILYGCKNVYFQMKFFNIFLIFAQNMDCGYTLEPPQRGGSNEYPQSMFWSKNKKKNVYPYKPQFYYIKVGCKGVFVTRTCFRDASHFHYSAHTVPYKAMAQLTSMVGRNKQSRRFHLVSNISVLI